MGANKWVNVARGRVKGKAKIAKAVDVADNVAKVELEKTIKGIGEG